MKINSLEWTMKNISHIAKHAVSPEEIEEICFRTGYVPLKERRDVYILLGKTESGRCLTIVIRDLGGGKGHCITAREMEPEEKRRFKELERYKMKGGNEL